MPTIGMSTGAVEILRNTKTLQNKFVCSSLKVKILVSFPLLAMPRCTARGLLAPEFL